VSAVARIARLSGAFLGSNLVRGALAFALSLLVGRALGVERFGRWVLCATWASTLTVAADLGFGVLLTRDGAHGAFRSLGSLTAAALTLRLLVALPAAAALAAAAPWMAADPETIHGLQIAAVLGVAGVAYGCFGAAFRSQPEWIPAVLAMEAGGHALQLAASFVALYASHAAGVGALLVIAVAAQLLQIGTALALWGRAFHRSERLHVPDRHGLRDTLVRALPFAAAGIVANLQTRLAPLMLGYLSTDADVGAFAAAARFGTTARLVPGAVFAGALPVLSQEHETSRDGTGLVFTAFDRAFAVLAAATVLPLLLFARPLLRLVYGPAFAGAATTLVWIGIGLAPALMNTAAKIGLYASGRERVATAWSAASLVVQAALATRLIPVYEAAGAATAVAIGEALIWLPLRRARRSPRTSKRSSPHRAPAPTHVPTPPVAGDVPDPAAAR
jgi:O-antigen/teichoic acid export membrane protein